MFLRIMIAGVMLISFCAKGLTVKTMISGNWENPNNWSNHQMPTNPDTIIVQHYMVINQNLIINSPAILLISAAGTICGPFLLKNVCGTKLINYGYIHTNIFETVLADNYGLIEYGYSMTLFGCGAAGGSFHNIPPNSMMRYLFPVECTAFNDEGGPTGLAEFEYNALNVYPNPVYNTPLNIVTLNSTKIRLTDITGKEIESKMFENTTTLNMDGLEPGVYFLTLEINGKKQTKKILKIN